MGLELRQAALDADSQLVQQIIQDVPEIYSLELKLIKIWLRKFQFENIIDITEPLSYL